MNRTALAALTLFTLAGAASGAPLNDAISYQGRLTTAGVPVSGNADLIFTVWDADSGGAQIGDPVELFDVPVQNGLFSADLDFGAGALAGQRRWLQIEVRSPAGSGSYTTLSPRQELTSAPSALGVRLPLSQSADLDGDDGVFQIESTGTAPAIKAVAPDTEAAIRSDGGIEVYNNNSLGARIQPFQSIGTVFEMYNDGGFPYAALYPDYSGIEGNFFGVFREGFAYGFGVTTTGLSDTYSTEVEIHGQASTIRFDTSESGDDSVRLPHASISDSEILSEPGVASAIEGSAGVDLTGGADVLLSRTINVPTDGYCVVIGACQPRINHTNGVTRWANFGVSDDPNSLPVNQDLSFQIPAGAGTGTYINAVSPTGTFEVSAGSNTFYLIADHGVGGSPSDWTVYDMQLTVMFFSANYGAVQPTVMTLGTGGDGSNPLVPPLSPAEISAEQLEALALDMERTEAEMTEQQRRLNEINSELQRVRAAHTEGGR